MDIFELRDKAVNDYSNYIRGFFTIKDSRIKNELENNVAKFWPDPWITLNPKFQEGGTVEDLINQGLLHSDCAKIFQRNKNQMDPQGLRFYKHQVQAIEAGNRGVNYLLTTGTGSGKSLGYIVPIVNRILEQKSGRNGKIKAIIIYPMNALANSQGEELNKFLSEGFPDKKGPISFARYTGQESQNEKENLLKDPPDILLTNYVMLELILTRTEEKPFIKAAQDLSFLVLDEIHTYRGRQGSDVAMLVRRAKQAFNAKNIQYIGTSATLASGGSLEEQKQQVANLAQNIFGSKVEPDSIIGESLRYATESISMKTADFKEKLVQRIKKGSVPTSIDQLRNDPLAIWIEQTMGIEQKDGYLLRAEPKQILGETGVARSLANDLNLEEDMCKQAIEEELLACSQIKDPTSGTNLFAFRLHQFISGGNAPLASLDYEDNREITIENRFFVPSQKGIFFPLAFCKECGQEYYSVEKVKGEKVKGEKFDFFNPRDLRDKDPITEPGFLYISKHNPWPIDPLEANDRIPVELKDENNKVDRTLVGSMPSVIEVDPNGRIISSKTKDSVSAAWFPSPIRFCLYCKVSYIQAGRSSDTNRLNTIGLGGRATSATVLNSSLWRLAKQANIEPKILTFIDNRQDASLQAGHFNDFVNTAFLRSSLYRALEKAGKMGISNEDLTQKVFDSLELSREEYASNEAEGNEKMARNIDRTFRNIIGYKLFIDLARNSPSFPNLEQLGLLKFEYIGLDDLAQNSRIWLDKISYLSQAPSDKRQEVMMVLLDWLRRQLAIHVEFLDQVFQEKFSSRSYNYLKYPWNLDPESESVDNLEKSRSIQTTPKRGKNSTILPLTTRGAFGQYIKKKFGIQSSSEVEQTINDLVRVLASAGFLREQRPRKVSDPSQYNLISGSMKWVLGNGNIPIDSLKATLENPTIRKPSKFFIDFYKEIASDLKNLSSAEHTAQINSDERQQREERFREGKLPVLFCSPTMELGIDIAGLNLVGMRNVPPTPANYAQRSGRAGRSGQAALVMTYCATSSNHDQYFFRKPTLMVNGQVTPAHLDFANEDLVKSHIHSLWLLESGISLKRSVNELLDLNKGEFWEFEESLLEKFHDSAINERTLAKANELLETIKQDIQKSDWWDPSWAERTISAIPNSFKKACKRWVDLYLSSIEIMNQQHLIISDPSTPTEQKEKAKRTRNQAENQINILLNEQTKDYLSDFYSYRYFASEGFLPGYSFSRLPLWAYVTNAKNEGDNLSRSRFLAISEFGPGNFIYHNGSIYQITQVQLPLGKESANPSITTSAKICDGCGYLYDDINKDICDYCKAELPNVRNNLFEMENVSTKRRNRINSQEEGRRRKGYEVRTYFSYAIREGKPSVKTALATLNDSTKVEFSYAPTASIYRINLGWSKRKKRLEEGFRLDLDNGSWLKEKDVEQSDGLAEEKGAKVKWVVPFVKDSKNALLVKPLAELSFDQMLSLGYALKHAIQKKYYLEDDELGLEFLPAIEHETSLSITPEDSDEISFHKASPANRTFLFYEASEGGAGILRQIIIDPNSLSEIAKEALSLCHFNKETLDDYKKAPGAITPCEKSCYECLMTYGNQKHHRHLNRDVIKDYLFSLSKAQIIASPNALSREKHLEQLMRLTDSSLEKKWLKFIDEGGYRLPDHAQYLFKEANTRADFFYKDNFVVIFIDGPVHNHQDIAGRDSSIQENLEDLGYQVIHFRYDDNWQHIVDNNPFFGDGKS